MAKKIHLGSPWHDNLALHDFKLPLIRRVRRVPLEFLDKLSLAHFYFFTEVVLKLIKNLPQRRNVDASWTRLLLTRVLPFDPLVDDPQTEMDLYILTHEKDIDILPTSLIGSVQSVKANLSQIYVVGPETIAIRVSQIITSMQINAKFISDEELLGAHLSKSKNLLSSVPRMEMIKIVCAIHSKSGIALVVDGDTIILRERIWASNEKSILIVAQEFLTRHVNFNEKILGIPSKSGLGFVAHHQVLVKKELEYLFSKNENLDSLGKRFQLAYTNFSAENNIFPSEWQLVGNLREYINQGKFCYAKFSNYGMSRDEVKWKLNWNCTLEEATKIVNEIRLNCPGLGSLSLHRYK